MNFQEQETPKGKLNKKFLAILAIAVAVDLVFVGVFICLTFYVKDITVTVNGKSLNYRTTASTVSDLLSDWDVKLDEGDVVEPGMNEKLKDGTKVNISLWEEKKKVIIEKTDYKSKKKYTSDLLEGETKVTTKGVKGEDKVTYKITYLGGKEQSRKEISRVTVKKPKTEIISEGTAVAINGEKYSRKLTVQATGYSGGGRTASGTRARVGEIAVDPSVIPLGSECYIEGFGTLYAEDTGGAVKGNIIDIYFSSNSAARQWGRRTVTIYIK